MAAPTLRAEMGTSDGGYDEPRLIVEWPDPRVPYAVVMAAVHYVIGAVWELRIGRGAGWPVIAPDSTERSRSGTRAVIVAPTWPRSASEAQEALAVLRAVAVGSGAAAGVPSKQERSRDGGHRSLDDRTDR